MTLYEMGCAASINEAPREGKLWEESKQTRAIMISSLNILNKQKISVCATIFVSDDKSHVR